MTDMTASHARTKNSAAVGLWAAWAVLLTMGGTSVTLQIWDATHAAHLFWLIAVLKGLAPVGAAMGLSEVGARYDGGKVFRGLCFAVMLGAMALSMSAIAAVMRPGSEPWAAWLFGVVLDAAALICLHVVLTGRRRKAAAAGEAETARAIVAEATGKAARLESELATVRAELSAELERAKAEHEAEVQALTSALNKALNKRPSSPRKRVTSSPPNKAPTSPLKPDVPDDVDTQAEALRILGEDPDISGGELGRRLGKSERYGCMLKNRLAASVAGPDISDGNGIELGSAPDEHGQNQNQGTANEGMEQHETNPSSQGEYGERRGS